MRADVGPSERLRAVCICDRRGAPGDRRHRPAAVVQPVRRPCAPSLALVDADRPPKACNTPGTPAVERPRHRPTGRTRTPAERLSAYAPSARTRDFLDTAAGLAVAVADPSPQRAKDLSRPRRPSRLRRVVPPPRPLARAGARRSDGRGPSRSRPMTPASERVRGAPPPWPRRALVGADRSHARARRDTTIPR